MDTYLDSEDSDDDGKFMFTDPSHKVKRKRKRKRHRILHDNQTHGCCQNKVMICSGCCSIFVIAFVITLSTFLYGFFGVVPPFPKTATGLNPPFDAIAAKRLAKWSSVAYCDTNTISDSWSCGSCTGNVTNVSTADNGFKGGIQAVIGVDHTLDMNNKSVGIVVAFRGTKALSNWEIDDDVRQVNAATYFTNNNTNISSSTSKMMVHKGYQEAYGVVREQVRAQVLPLCGLNQRIRVTGHSLGAAVAQLCAFDFSENPVCNNSIPGQTITFGALRTGNIPFVQGYNTSLQKSNMDSWRVVHYADSAANFIPKTLNSWAGIPVPGSPFTYRHVGREVWYSEDNKDYTVCDGSGEDPKCSGSLPLSAQRILDHQVYMEEVIFPCGTPVSMIPAVTAIMCVLGLMSLCCMSLCVFKIRRTQCYLLRSSSTTHFVSLDSF